MKENGKETHEEKQPGEIQHFLSKRNREKWELLHIKTESIRKLSNFNFQWTKTLYQNNLKYITFFFTLFKSYRCNLLPITAPKTISYLSPRK